MTHVQEDIFTLDCCPCLDVCYGVSSSALTTRVTVFMVDVCLSNTFLTIHGLSVLNMSFSGMRKYDVLNASSHVLHYFGACFVMT